MHKLFQHYLDVPESNIITSKEYKTQLENLGFQVEIKNITKQTLVEFYKYGKNNFSNIIVRYASYITDYLLQKSLSFKYILVKAKKY